MSTPLAQLPAPVASVVDGTTVGLTWATEDVGVVDSSNVQAKFESDGHDGPAQSTTNFAADLLAGQVTGLTTGTSYIFLISAAGHGDWSDSPYSDSSNAVTPADAPPPPPTTQSAGPLIIPLPGVTYARVGSGDGVAEDVTEPTTYTRRDDGGVDQALEP